MSEPQITKPPKRYSVFGYLFFTTLWAFLLPGAVINGPISFLLLLNGGPGIDVNWFALGACAVCGLLLFLCVVLIIRFSANHQAGQVPGSFALWILPFWIPLFWGLAVSAVCLYFTPTLFPASRWNLMYAFPQYLIPLGFVLLFGTITGALIISSIVTFLCAAAGTIHVACIAPPVPKWRALILYSIITFILCGFVSLAYNHFRAEVFLPSYHDERMIVREERDRNLYRSDTDLSEYIPFTENNKLVKVGLPAFFIDFGHPKIHGAFALYPVYAAAVEALYRDTEKIQFDYRHWDAHVTVGTSPQAFGSLLNDNIKYRSDMVFMARPSGKQLQEAADKGIELVITPIGYEAFVFFVSTINPVEGLTLDQIRDIYSKKITRWNEVGGRNERILPFQRPEGSGSQTAMLRVMGEVPLAPPLKEEFRRDMGGIVADVADYRNYGNSIGFSFRYYVEGLFKHDGVKLLKINGIAPTIENIQNGSYPLIGELVIISRADNTNLNVPKLTEWFLSPQGQKLVQDVGYVPLETNR